MTELLTSAQMRAVERAAIESGAVSGLELMERAGAGVVAAVFATWPALAPEPVAQDDPAGEALEGEAPIFATAPHDSPGPRREAATAPPHRAVVLCGPGNNGGDGFVVARLLAGQGWNVEVFLYGEVGKLPPDARANFDRWRERGAVRPLRMAEVDLFGAELVVDALFGTGLTRPLDGEALLAANALATRSYGDDPVVAVDAPSGMCMDSGRPLVPAAGDGVAAAGLTVSFHALKLGHVLAAGPARCGQVVVADIGLTGSAGVAAARAVAAPDPDRLAKTADHGHKYTHGHALVLAGASGKGGAARLAARAALRVGAGLVTLAPTPGATQENAAQLNAVMLTPVGDAETLARVLADDRLTALALGPGLGLDRARALAPVALGDGGGKPRPAVLDADALTAFAEDPAALFALLHENCVLTPHVGEFARLFPDIAERLAAPATAGPAYSKLDATRAAAARAGCTLLYKGPDTVIADPSGRASVHVAAYERTAPWLATAGAGDVLTGLIAGLMARGLAPKTAAETASWLHVEAAIGYGPGLIAEDLPEGLPQVFTALGL